MKNEIFGSNVTGCQFGEEFRDSDKIMRRSLSSLFSFFYDYPWLIDWVLNKSIIIDLEFMFRPTIAILKQCFLCWSWDSNSMPKVDARVNLLLDYTPLPEKIQCGVKSIWLPAMVEGAKTIDICMKLTCYEYEVDGVPQS